MKKYTILAYNFNGYEIMREPREVDPECDYVYVTDNASLANYTSVWRVVVDEDLYGLTPFDKCYRVRFNLFKYVKTPVCIYLDASLQINKSLRKLYDDFMSSGKDIGLKIHPSRDTVIDEYNAWLTIRDYDPYQMNKCLYFMNIAGYDTSFNGLYQLTMRLCRNTELNRKLDTFVYDTLVKLGTWGTIERLDQTVYSFIVNRYFKDLGIFPISSQALQSDYLTWCSHGATNAYKYNTDNDKSLVYVKGELVEPYFLR